MDIDESLPGPCCWEEKEQQKLTHTSSVFQSLAAAVLIIPNLDYKITVKFKYIEKNYDDY